MTVPAGDDDRDDVDARFADIVARWEDPPPEALPDSHDSPNSPNSPDSPDSPDSHDSTGTPDVPRDTADGPGDPERPEVFDPPRPSEARAASDTGSSGVPPAPVAGGAAPVPRGPDDADGPEEPHGCRAPQDDGWRSYSPPEDPDDDHFTPPPPRPLPSFWLDWPFYLALVGIVGGPLLLIYLSVFGPARADLMWMAGGLAVAGFVTLVLRTPRERDPYDGDDGARV